MSEYSTSPEQSPLELASDRADFILENVLRIETEVGVVQSTALATRREDGTLDTHYKLASKENADDPGNIMYALEINSPDPADEVITLGWRRGSKEGVGFIELEHGISARRIIPELEIKIAEILARSEAYDPKKQTIIPGFRGKEDRIVAVSTAHKLLRVLGILSQGLRLSSSNSHDA